MSGWCRSKDKLITFEGATSDVFSFAFLCWLGRMSRGGERLRGMACLANMAWMRSLRSAIGWMKVADSVPILPTSLGTW